MGNEIPPDEFGVEAMVLDEGSLVLATESEFVFLGYSPTEEADPKWQQEVKGARRLYQKRMYGE